MWVVWALATLFGSDIGAHLVFKGGAPLSKAYSIIRRFSEDVDLTYDIRAIAPDFSTRTAKLCRKTAARRSGARRGDQVGFRRFCDRGYAAAEPSLEAGGAHEHDLYESAYLQGCQGTKTSETAPIMPTTETCAARAIWLDQT